LWISEGWRNKTIISIDGSFSQLLKHGCSNWKGATGALFFLSKMNGIKGINGFSCQKAIFHVVLQSLERAVLNGQRSRSTMDSIRVSEALDSGSIPDETTTIRV